MKRFYRIVALALALSSSVAMAQTNQGSSPLTPAKGGTNSAYVGFTGPASTVKTFTLPDQSDTIATLGAIQTFTAAKTFASGKLLLGGSSSGAGTLNAPAAASSYVWTLPALTDTLVSKTSTDTLTNKTYDTAGTGNSFSINGLAATANTGTGAVARATSPTFVTPTLGAATATSINGNTWTAGTGTLTLGAGKTATISNTLAFTGTDASSVAFGTGGTVAYTANNLSAFAATTSLQLAGVISDETGSGALVFGTSPALTTPTLGVASATSVNKVAITAPATSATLTIPDGVTLTGPAASGTAMTLGNAETVAGAKSFNSGTVILKGSSSGTTAVNASATASGTLTLPAATDTLMGKATTDTLTNKTFDTAGTGNSFSINGVAATANTGTGSVVRATSPTLTTPVIASIVNTGTLTLPTSSDTLMGRATTDTLTNKTFDTAGTGNSFSINGIAATANTGTGAVARAVSPSFTTPTIGVATATSVNKMAITAPATSSTLAVADGKTLTASNTLTLAGTDSTTLTFQGTDTYVGRTTTDTLTNKSISGSSNTITNVPASALGVMTGDSGSGGAKGAVPAPGAGDYAALKYLDAGGNWSVPAGGGGGGVDDTTRRNILLSQAMQAKNFGAYIRNINVFADGYAGSDGINSGSSSGYTVSGSKYVGPSTLATTPSYANTGGTGARTGSITVTSTISFQGGTAPSLVDGSFTQDTTNGLIFTSGASSGALKFDFGSGASKVITEAKWYQGDASTHATMQWSGSNDDSSYTTIGSTFVAGGSTTQTQTSLSGNTTGYRYYKLSIISGAMSNSPFVTEIEFKIGDAGANMTVVTTSQTADATVSNGRVLIEYDPISSVTLNTDVTVEVTADNGSHWTSATLSSVGTGQSGHSLAETSDQAIGTSGTSFAARIKTLNLKNVRFYKTALVVH